MEPKASLVATHASCLLTFYGLQPRVLEQLICSSCSYIFYLPCYLIDPSCGPAKKPSQTLQHMLYILYVLPCPDKEHKNQKRQETRGGGSPVEQYECKSLGLSLVSLNLCPLLPGPTDLLLADSSSLEANYLFRF